MSGLILADAHGLLSLWQDAPQDKRVAMLSELTRFVEQGSLGFPREVVGELETIDRAGAVSS